MLPEDATFKSQFEEGNNGYLGVKLDYINIQFLRFEPPVIHA